MSKTFVTAGVSKLNGKFALRATNREGDTYATILKKEGHEEVHLVKLKKGMTKEEIKAYLPGLKAFQTPEILAALKGDEAAAKKGITKPTQAAAPAKPKKKGAAATGSKKKKKDEAAPAASDGSEVATQEGDDGEHVDVASELGSPAFAKHVADE